MIKELLHLTICQNQKKKAKILKLLANFYGYDRTSRIKCSLKTIFSAFFLISCVGESSSSDQEYPIDKIDVDVVESVLMSDFIKSVKYIPLSDSGGALLGAIDKVRMDDDRIYVLDMYQAVGLFVFDHQGNLIFAIQNYGRGPGEFMGPYDFTIDYDNDEIAIYDARGLKICFYDKTTGQFLREQLLDFRFRRFEAINGGFLFHTDNRPDPDMCCNMIKTDRGLNVVEEFIPIKDEMRKAYMMSPTNFSSHEDTLFFYSHNDYNIYRSVNGDFAIYKSFDFGEKNAPEEYYAYKENRDEREEILKDNVGMVLGYFRTDDIEYVKYHAESTFYIRISFLNSGRIIHTRSDLLVNDLNAGPQLGFALETYKNFIVWVAPPYHLTNFLAKKRKELSLDDWAEFQRNNPDLIELSTYVSRESNPYLVLTEFKN